MTEKVTLVMTSPTELELAHGTKCHDLHPKALLLLAAAKCAGLTMLHIMKKEQFEPKRFEITLSGELTTDKVLPESLFSSFNVIYNVDCGDANDQAKASHAINLTHDKYCGLLQMLRKIAPVTHQAIIVATQPTEL